MSQESIIIQCKTPQTSNQFIEFSPLLLLQEFYIAFKFNNNKGRQSGHPLTRHGVGTRRFHVESCILIWGFDGQILFQFKIICFMILYGKP
jgi:hypothetical protein